MARGSQFKYYLYNDRSKLFLEIGDGSICGRSEGDLKFPQDDLVSRKHCKFTIVGNDVYIEDCGATNKTKVNAVAIVPLRKRRVQLNDVIEIGLQRFILTNQNRHVPAHIQDVKTPIFKAAKKADGSLTKVGTGLILTRTLVLLDRASFRKLRISKAMKPLIPYTGISMAGAVLIGLWLTLFLWLDGKGGFEATSTEARNQLLGIFAILASLSSVLFLSIWFLLIPRIFTKRKLLGRLAAIVSFVLVGMASYLAADRVNLISGIDQNIFATFCRDHGYWVGCSERIPANSQTSQGKNR